MTSKVAGVFLVAVALVFGLATPAVSTPAPTAPPNEGSGQTLDTLRANLEAAAVGYIEAEALLEASKAKQAEFELRLQTVETEMAKIKTSVARYASEAYKTGRLGPISMMLSASSQDNFLQRAMALDRMTSRDQAGLQQYMALKLDAELARARIATEIEQQNLAVAEMQKRKTAAERALAVVGGTTTRTEIDPATLPVARPAPRNSDGSWPAETCSEDDPTPASGCITPRTLHALNETQRLGWDHYVSCYRPGDKYEHPKGRACDWATASDGFRGTAAGPDKVYGDRLAAFYAKNAKALGVMYVVWYCQIWHVGTGWRRYNSTGSRCGDNPAGDHTNHVHLSVY